jgi:very-short-patch-repair endonuclease
MATDMFYGAGPQLFENAKRLRDNMTGAEQLLWGALQNNKVSGFRFKPQHPISYFVADFYCHAARLIIELDGAFHDAVDQSEYDANRTYMLEELGLRVIRFRNEEVVSDINNVLARIIEQLQKNQTTPKSPKGDFTQERAKSPLGDLGVNSL